MENSPYPGTRPFARGDVCKLYGRGAETRALLQLIEEGRMVLASGPSGAGLTSLLNARVIPALEAQGAVILPVARVGFDLPPGTDLALIGNPYVFGVLQSLALIGGKIGSDLILAQTLVEGLEICLPSDQMGGRVGVLVVDQLEELLRGVARNTPQVEDFFRQLSLAMEAQPALKIVLAARAASLPALEPFLALLPGGVTARFTMDLLDEAAALEAISAPAAEAGCPFTPDSAKRLVEYLRAERAPLPERALAASSSETLAVDRTEPETSAPAVSMPAEAADAPSAPGGTHNERWVEPLQLQLACSAVWASLPEQSHLVQIEDLPGLVDVDRALGSYYDLAVHAAAVAGKVREYDVRAFFDQKLVTTDGARAWLEPGDTGGLPGKAVRALENLHLLRAEIRDGKRWLALANERWIAPLQQANQAWERARETPLRRVARRWKETGDRSLLYRGEAFRALEQQALAQLAREGKLRKKVPKAELDAYVWQHYQVNLLDPFEMEFYQASRKVQQNVRALRWAGLALLGLAVLAVFLVVLVSLVTGLALQREQASRPVVEERPTAVTVTPVHREPTPSATATVQRQAVVLATQAYEAMQRAEPRLALLLGAQSLGLAQSEGKSTLASEQVLRETLAQVSGIPLAGHTQAVTRAIASADGRWLLTLSKGDAARLWDLSSGQPEKGSLLIGGDTQRVNDAAFSPDGHWLATASENGALQLWNVSSADPTAQPRSLVSQGESLSIVRFDPHGRWLAAASTGGQLRLWDWQAADLANSVTLLKDTSGSSAGTYTSLAFCPDGACLAAGSNTGLWRWDLSTAQDGNEPAAANELLAPSGPVSVQTLAFSPDGRWLAAGGAAGDVLLWDMDTSDPAQVLGSHPGGTDAVAFSPDGCWLASGGQDQKARLWLVGSQRVEGKPGEPVYTLEGHSAAVSTLAFPPLLDDGQGGTSPVFQLATGSEDHTIRMWDLSSVLVQGSGCQHASPDTGEPIPLPTAADTQMHSAVLRGLDGAVTALVFTPGERWLAAGGTDGARIWPLQPQYIQPADTSTEPRVLPSGLAAFTAVSSPDGRWLAAGGSVETSPGGWAIWDLNAPQQDPWMGTCGGEDRVTELAVHPNSSLFAAACSGGQVFAWQTTALRPGNPMSADLLATLGGQVGSLAFSADGKWLSAGDWQGELYVWPVEVVQEGGIKFGEPLPLTGHKGRVRAAFDPQGRWLASTGDENTLLLHDMNNLAGPPLFSMPFSSGVVVDALVFSPDGRWLAAGARDQHIYLWDLKAFQDGTQPSLYTFSGYDQAVWALAFSPDSRWLAGAGMEPSFRLWDLEKIAAAQNLLPDPDGSSYLLKGHSDSVMALAFSPDGRWLLSSGSDSTVRRWDLRDPLSTPLVLTGHQLRVRSVIFLNNTSAASAAEDGMLRIWTVRPEDLLRIACAQAGRGFTADETAHYFPRETPQDICH